MLSISRELVGEQTPTLLRRERERAWKSAACQNTIGLAARSAMGEGRQLTSFAFDMTRAKLKVRFVAAATQQPGSGEPHLLEIKNMAAGYPVRRSPRAFRETGRLNALGLAIGSPNHCLGFGRRKGDQAAWAEAGSLSPVHPCVWSFHRHS